MQVIDDDFVFVLGTIFSLSMALVICSSFFSVSSAVLLNFSVKRAGPHCIGVNKLT